MAPAKGFAVSDIKHLVGLRSRKTLELRIVQFGRYLTACCCYLPRIDDV